MVWKIGKCTTKGQLKLFEIRVKYTNVKIKHMKGYFDEKSLETYKVLVANKTGVDFSEGEVYDFTRCLKASGETYGTDGQCKKGVPTAKAEKKRKSIMSKLKDMIKAKMGRNMSQQEIAQAEGILGWKIPPGQTADDVLRKLLPKGSKVGIPTKTA